MHGTLSLLFFHQHHHPTNHQLDHYSFVPCTWTHDFILVAARERRDSDSYVTHRGIEAHQPPDHRTFFAVKTK